MFLSGEGLSLFAIMDLCVICKTNTAVVVVVVVDFFFPYNKNWTALPKLNRRQILFTGYKADVVLTQGCL